MRTPGQAARRLSLERPPLRWFDRRVMLLPLHASSWRGMQPASTPSSARESRSPWRAGEVAAGATIDAFARRDFSFRDYKRRLLRHSVTSQLMMRSFLADALYSFGSPRVQRQLFAIAPWVVRCISLTAPKTIPINPPRLFRIS